MLRKQDLENRLKRLDFEDDRLKKVASQTEFKIS